MTGRHERVGDLDVSRETLDRLRTYAALLERWTPRINLVAPSTVGDLWTRHIVDSAQLFSLAPDTARRWVDLGSGGGLPGVVIAAMAADSRPDLQVHLVESDQRKAVFLRTVAREIGLSFSVHAVRAESLDPLDADVLSARALAPLDRLLDLAKRHLRPGGLCLFPKGATWRDEVRTALARHAFRCEEVESSTAPHAVILKIGDIVRD
jgi:16S rRNA (guanine527-N7)-methyltransferase